LAITAVEAPLYVYPKASGSPKTYYKRWELAQDCAYAGDGLLYVVGIIGDTTSVFRAAAWELTPLHSLERVHFRDPVHFTDSGGAQWDGKHITWGDANHREIYQFATHGRLWSIVGTTSLTFEGSMGEFAIHGHVAIVPYVLYTSGSNSVGFFHYPEGGASFAAITGFQDPVAVAYSAATRS
jgi:hypothetical protein